MLLAEWRFKRLEARTADGGHGARTLGYWVSDTYGDTKNVSVRETAFAELRNLLGLKPKTYA